MTREEVIKLAREVGINIEKSNVGDALAVGWPIKAGAFERFYCLVRQRALEDAISAALDAVAFTGGTVDTESHVRGAIEDLKVEL